MSMQDFIIGNVTEVISGDTFEVKVVRIGKNNIYHYERIERVHIGKLKPAEMVTLCGECQKPHLERMLKDREVLCIVNSRDSGGEITADVYMI